MNVCADRGTFDCCRHGPARGLVGAGIGRAPALAKLGPQVLQLARRVKRVGHHVAASLGCERKDQPLGHQRR